MRKYNRRILTALVVAYKKGIINKKPLNRWLNFEQIFYRSIKYISYLVLFTFILIILKTQNLQDLKLDENIYIGKYFIQKSRIVSGLLIGIVFFNLYQLVNYYSQVYVVKNAMKHYKSTNNDVEILNRVTYKINV